MEAYKNPSLSPEDRAADLLGRMSIEEKVAQLTCILAFPEHPEYTTRFIKDGIGQVSTLNWRAMKTLEEASFYQRLFQEQIIAASPHGIPAVFHMEGLCGAYIQGALSLPAGIARASGFDPELEESLGEVVSRQELSVGITQTLAPVLDISREPRMGRQGETYGEDPTLAAAMGAAFTRGIQKNKIDGRHSESVAKHFLGFHGSQGGIHGAHCEISPRTLEEIYGKPFQAAISESNLRGIMPCYCVMDGMPISASRKHLTGLLRDQMGFDGVVVADYSAISNVYTSQKSARSMAEAGLRCLRAGLDVELPHKTAYADEMVEAFRSGQADMQVLDTAVMRVLRAKFRMGLFENPFGLQGKELEDTFFDDGDYALTLQSARQSLILLKNNGALPIANHVRKVALIGCHGDNARSLFGGYTHLSMVEAIHAVKNSLAGISKDPNTPVKPVTNVPGTDIQSDETDEFDAILRLQKPDCKSLLQQLRSAHPDVEFSYAYGYPIAGNDTSHFDEALQIAAQADLVLLTLGGKHGSCSVASMGEGVDATDINLPYCQDEFIRRVSKLGKPLIGIHFNGRPISSDAADEHLDAILEAWNPSECGAQAIEEVLFGTISPSGKLPVTVARSAGQLPIYYNHPWGSMWHQGESIGFTNYVDMTHLPRYHFGHGLSYTTFDYGALTLDRESVAPHGSLTARLRITNTGNIAATEVVQLYASTTGWPMTRPVLELIGFCRVTLEPGQSKDVSFCFSPTQLAFLDEDMRWRIEQGEVELFAGSSCADLRAKTTFWIDAVGFTTSRERKYYCLGTAQ